jgi:ligand-binding sensor domain-containing protein
MELIITPNIKNPVEAISSFVWLTIVHGLPVVVVAVIDPQEDEGTFWLGDFCVGMACAR